MNLKQHSIHKKGFTLLEIMAVVGIIALLSAIVIPNILAMRIRANDAVAQSTLRTIYSSLQNYMNVHSRYPDSTDDLIGDTPPYLNKDYFDGTHSGFTYTADLNSYSYNVRATPDRMKSTGSAVFLVTEEGKIEEAE